jgi:hypothetical protein
VARGQRRCSSVYRIAAGDLRYEQTVDVPEGLLTRR